MKASHGFAYADSGPRRGHKGLFADFLTPIQLSWNTPGYIPGSGVSRKGYLVDMAWKTYYYRWTGLYRDRLTATQWVRAAFALPFIPDYYRAVRTVLIGASLSALLEPIQKYFPGGI